jgi:putative hemolysin
MEILLDVGIILLLIVLNGLFALSELALVSSNRARLTVLERKGHQGAALARRLSEDPHRFLPTVQVGITMISILSGVFGGAHVAALLTPMIAKVPALAPFAESLGLGVVVVLITYFTMVIGELVPKQLALRRPEIVASYVAGPLAKLASITRPIVFVLSRSSSFVLLLFGAPRAAPQTVTEEELKAILAEGEETGVIETEERDMIERVLRLADKPVRAIMTPRTGIPWIDRNDTPEEIAETLKSAGFSRFIVCDGAVDNPVGIVLAKDLLDSLLAGKTLSIADALRHPQVIPDTATAMDALARLRSDPLGMALVLDEYGSFEGVVTATDALQAIVGDPENSAPDPITGTQQDDSALLLEGLMPVDEVQARLDLPALPAAGSYHTLAGLILALLRRVPREGDRIAFAGWLFEVTAMDGRRVEKVRASREKLAE